jgi:hypothetical protein
MCDNEGTCMLIDTANSGDMCDQENEKVLKFKDLTKEIWCMWNVK